MSTELIELNPSRFLLPSRPYQLEETRKLLRSQLRGLFWEMRLGKSKVVIDTACTLMEAEAIDCCLIVCPAQVKDVWIEPDLGEIKTHCWLPMIGAVHNGTEKEYPVYVQNYCAKYEDLEDLFFNFKQAFIVTSLEFLRQEDAQGHFPKVQALLKALQGKRVNLVIDEGSALGVYNSLQVRAITDLRKGLQAPRVVELDGTPEGESPLCLYSKFKVLDEDILGFKNYFHFRARHCEMTKQKYGQGKAFKKITGWKNLEELTRKTAPFVSRLTQRDVGFKEPVRSFITSKMTEKTWRVYRQLRDEMVAELESGESMFVKHAHTKVLRLAQVCAGYLGGFDPLQPDDLATVTVEVGEHTLLDFMNWFEQRLEEKPDFKCVVWCRFTPEIGRLYRTLEIHLPKLSDREVQLGLYCGQTKDVNFLHPQARRTNGPSVMICQPQAAQYGLNFSQASVNFWLSGDYRRVTRRQAEDRIQALNSEGVLTMDCLVTGPNGQKTIVHDIMKVQRDKATIANRISSDWKRILLEE